MPKKHKDEDEEEEAITFRSSYNPLPLPKNTLMGCQGPSSNGRIPLPKSIDVKKLTSIYNEEKEKKLNNVRDGRVQKRTKGQNKKLAIKQAAEKAEKAENATKAAENNKQSEQTSMPDEEPKSTGDNAEKQTAADPNAGKNGNTGGGVIKSFVSKLAGRLLGGRFRFLNEQLYTSTSSEAENLFKNDPVAFDAYHQGYQQQVEKWPSNPLERMIRMVNKLPKTYIIADMGCGTGQLAKRVPHKVYSIDLVSRNKDIIASDMANTPLGDRSIDCVVYCLSLMGTNLKDFLLEANRILKKGGLVYIAEVSVRFGESNPFMRGMTDCGFELITKDSGKGVFTFMQYRKVKDVDKKARVAAFTLSPCLYRKR